MHHDPQLSTRKTAVMYWGHSWVLLGVIARLPFCPARAYCLPILFRLYVGKKSAEKKQLAYRMQPELAIAMLHRLCQSHEHRRFHAIADSACGGSSVLNHLPGNCDLTNQLALNALLYEAPTERKPGVGGRPRKRGRRLPRLLQMFLILATRLALNLYGRHDRSRAAETVARVHNAPTPPLKVVAVERTAPTAMLPHGLIVLWFARIGHRHDQTPLRPWYTTKRHPSFADLLATLRQLNLEQEVSSLRPTGRGSRQVIKTLLQTLPRAA